MEIGPSVIPPAMIQADNFPFLGRNYTCGPDLSELNRVLRAGSMGVNPQMQAQLNPGCFTISGLNLNLDGGPATQPVLRPMQSPALNPQEVASSMMTAGSLAPETSYGGEISNAGVPGNRFMGMENCMELDGYWPSY